uniref:Uncharacterized protein n=1 Tax=Kalanchoe fedtschenkoi TaxID=63787 RepID=A0A7N0SXN1_KALFE
MAAHVPSNSSSSPLRGSPRALLPYIKTTTDHVRNLAKFPSSKWSQAYNKCAPNDVDLSAEWRQIEELKGEVGIKFDLYADKPLQQLTLIDSIQQLGLGYLFQEQIDQALTYMTNVDIDGYGLHQMSLYFRLERQHGHDVSPSIFKKFMGKDGALEEGFQSDVLGMVSFYEAAQLRVHADAAILDKAFARCVTHLESMAADLNPRLKTLVTNSLKLPIHKNMPWLQARKYISTYQEDESHDTVLLKLAKLHFNVLQKQHKQELSHLSKWWKDVDIVSKCPYARDKLVEGYFWSLALYYEPYYSLGRKILSMAIAYIAVLDDTYDAYGTADELELITESINRALKKYSTQVYLRKCARALCETVFDVYSLIEEDLLKDGNVTFSLPYVKEAVSRYNKIPISTINTFLREVHKHDDSYLLVNVQMKLIAVYYISYVQMKLMAKSFHNEYLWLKKKEIPTMEEYRQLSFASSGVTSLLILSSAGMGHIVTKEALDWIFSEPTFVIAAQGIVRFLDDIVSHEFEQQRQHVPSAVECYMNQYKVSKEEACQYLRKQVSDCWKSLNEGILKPTSFPFPVLERVLNIVRGAEVMYEDGDGFTHSQKLMEPKMTSLLKDPVAI